MLKIREDVDLKILELFGGIGACSKALERLGIDYEIADYVEIDKYAVKSFNAMHNTNFEPQDICNWDKDIEVDLIMHGSPCQDFSLAGLGQGGEEDSGTRSSLMWETVNIVEKLKPKYVIWENVKAVLNKNHKETFNRYLDKMSDLGYTNYYQVLNAKDYGIPQNRERVFTISIRNDLNQSFIFPEKQELKLKLKDLLEDEVDEKYYLSDKMLDYCTDMTDRNGFIRGERFNPLNPEVDDKAFTVTTSGGSRPTDNFIKVPEATQKEGAVVVVKGNYSPSGHNASRIVDNQGVATPTVIGGIGEKKSNGGTQWYQQDRIYDNKIGLSISTTAIPYYPDNELRIRKLTPKECWRLMGFDDEDFEKAEAVNSNTQLYKQAGNSIVVNVLEAIFKELL